MPQHKIHHDDANFQSGIARAREVIARCIEVLQQPRPDTVLGRERHEPIPLSRVDEPIIDHPVQTEQPDLSSQPIRARRDQYRSLPGRLQRGP
jgi:hypothetical protein